MIVIIGSDHGALDLKKELVQYLTSVGVNIIDVGTNSYDSCDYPKIAEAIINAYRETGASHVIALCGTGVGMANAITRYPGIKSISSSHPSVIKKETLKYGINTLVLGGRTTTFLIAKQCVDAFLGPVAN